MITIFVHLWISSNTQIHQEFKLQAKFQGPMVSTVYDETRSLWRFMRKRLGSPFTLPKTNSSHLKIGRNPIGKQYSNHPFLGAMLVSGRVIPIQETISYQPWNNTCKWKLHRSYSSPGELGLWIVAIQTLETTLELVCCKLVYQQQISNRQINNTWQSKGRQKNQWRYNL